MLDTVQDACHACLRGDVPPPLRNALDDNYQDFFRRLVERRRAGKSLKAACTTLLNYIEADRSDRNTRRRLQAIQQTRLYLGVIILAVVRFWLTGKVLPTDGPDAIGLALAAITSGGTHYLAQRYLPVSWLDPANPELAPWLEALSEHFAGESPQAVQLRHLVTEEIASGRSQRHARELVISKWASELSLRHRQNLDKYSDILPIIDLFGIGLPAALALAAPLADALK